jgi:hypothetical protein
MTPGRMVQRNKGGAHWAGDIRGSIRPGVIGPHKPTYASAVLRTGLKKVAYEQRASDVKAPLRLDSRNERNHPDRMAKKILYCPQLKLDDINSNVRNIDIKMLPSPLFTEHHAYVSSAPIPTKTRLGR